MGEAEAWDQAAAIEVGDGPSSRFGLETGDERTRQQSTRGSCQ